MIVAILILSVISVVLVGVIPSAMMGMKSAENRAVASVVASGVLERLREGDFDVIESGDAASVTSNGTLFHVSVEVGPVTFEDRVWSAEKAKDVQVHVMWKDRTTWRREADVQLFTARSIVVRE